MKSCYRLLFGVLIAMVFGIAICEETIEVPVDNAPQPSKVEKNVYERVNALKMDADKLDTEIKTQAEHFAAEEQKIGKETNMMKERVEKKQKSLDIWDKELKRMHSRIEELKAEVAELERRASVLNEKATFIDCVVDLIERYVLPAGEWLYGKAAEYWVIVKAYILKGYAWFIAFWSTNEYTQATQHFVVKYVTICVNLSGHLSSITSSIVDFWNNTVYPTIMRLYEPYAPKVKEVMNRIIDATVPVVKKYGMMAYVWTVDKLAMQYEMMKNTKYVRDYADVLMYITIVHLLNALWHAALLVLVIVTFPLRYLCPCRRCCKCCASSKN